MLVGITKAIFIFSSFRLASAVFESNWTAAVHVYQPANGEHFIEKIVNGEKLSRADHLLFTAPYKLCEGGNCNNNNFAMVFPLFVGKSAMKHYKEIYNRDYKNLHFTHSIAPFTRRTTKHPFTLCPVYETTSTSTQAPCHSENPPRKLSYHETEANRITAPITVDRERLKSTVVEPTDQVPIYCPKYYPNWCIRNK